MDRVAPSLDSADCNCLAIRQAARQVTQFYDRYLNETGLRTTQYSILSKLLRLGPQSINELAALMAMDRTTTGRAVRPLERDKLIALAPGADGRTRVMQLTAQGRARLKEALPLWRDAQRDFETRYGAADAVLLRGALGRVVSLH
jgi:DNA-binding MarR family transcriptional regulator